MDRRVNLDLTKKRADEPLLRKKMASRRSSFVVRANETTDQRKAIGDAGEESGVAGASQGGPGVAVHAIGAHGTEIVRLFARFALGASFLSAVADRFGLWGPYGAKNVSWGNFAHFVEYTGAVTSLFPSSLTVSFAWAATVAETLLGILLIAGFKIRMASVLSGLLLLSFAIGMITGLGIKTPFDYSVFSAAAAAFLLAFWEPDRFTLDKLLNRLRN